MKKIITSLTQVYRKAKSAMHTTFQPRFVLMSNIPVVLHGTGWRCSGTLPTSGGGGGVDNYLLVIDLEKHCVVHYYSPTLNHLQYQT